MKSEKSKPSIFLIKKAVLMNTCRPLNDEVVDVDPKSIRVSQKREGDSQLGMLLFIGVALNNGWTKGELSVVEGLDQDEINFKQAKFNELLNRKDKDRFQNKVKLIENYIRIYKDGTSDIQ